MASNAEKGNPSSIGNAPSSNPLSRKLNKILETRLENDKDILEALNALSGFFVRNDLRSRRNLRSDIEKRSLAINEQFVDAFGKVYTSFNTLRSEIEAMNESCNQMTERLMAAKSETSDLITKTSKLHNEKQQLQMRARLANLFLEKFQLSPSEIKILHGSRNDPIKEEFFDALDRVKQIHNDCKLLLRTSQQTAGLKIMESMALSQEAAFERLYRWTQSECRMLTGDTTEVSSMLTKAMEALQDRPVLFKYSLDEVSSARRTAIVRGFIDALTRGGPGGTPRPIEMHSHDPQRYIGDMLAWLHQGVASEKELLQSLLKKVLATDTAALVKEVLTHVTEGVCRPLKVRIEQVLMSEPGPKVMFKLNNIIKFYCSILRATLTNDSPLVNCLGEMDNLSMKMFYASLNSHSAKLLDKVELPPPNLGPTETLIQGLVLLRELLASYDAPVAELEDRQIDLKKILSCIVDPLLQMCTVSAASLSAADMACYMINCIYCIHSTLALYEFTDDHLEKLKAQIDAHMDTLVSEQAGYILAQSGLGFIYSTLQEQQNNKIPLSSVHGMDAKSVKSALVKFDSYLSSHDALLMPHCALLLSTKIRERVQKQSVELVCNAYESLYKAVYNPFNEYKEPSSVIIHTSEQVKKLLT
ncbi:Conserved oligomeric Golgi complex subunit 6 [Trichoplax sp. H2]|nr:Conserved oligomeric Golgi complex subunit 6 [Trichoplax sp. H2]|eukprot:RDD46726.1 Conserved oligomeric Golgi complex subunit 6 [Trichoplax sp. H2]